MVILQENVRKKTQTSLTATVVRSKAAVEQQLGTHTFLMGNKFFPLYGHFLSGLGVQESYQEVVDVVCPIKIKMVKRSARYIHFLIYKHLC